MAAAPAIDFHFNVEHSVNHACRVARKARTAGKTVLVYCRDAQRLARLDQALWTFSALDFLAHVSLPSPFAEQTPIWLSAHAPTAKRDVLLLLDDQPAAQFESWFARFERIIDVVATDPGERALGRARFRSYRDAGFTPVAHDIAA